MEFNYRKNRRNIHILVQVILYSTAICMSIYWRNSGYSIKIIKSIKIEKQVK